MKSLTLVRLVVATLAVMPMAAISRDTEVLQSCINTFVTENFPGQSPTIRIEDNVGSILPLQFKPTRMKLVANSKLSGEVLATAVCNLDKGIVVVGAVEKIAAVR
ncbi:MAG TPA: hypothetical protein VK629_21885 [Steroidobacteraceae bacterium]|nr:hypothetical protein [Steroidobacteraceae bacterium]